MTAPHSPRCGSIQCVQCYPDLGPAPQPATPADSTRAVGHE